MPKCRQMPHQRHVALLASSLAGEDSLPRTLRNGTAISIDGRSEADNQVPHGSRDSLQGRGAERTCPRGQIAASKDKDWRRDRVHGPSLPVLMRAESSVFGIRFSPLSGGVKTRGGKCNRLLLFKKRWEATDRRYATSCMPLTLPRERAIDGRCRSSNFRRSSPNDNGIGPLS